MAMQEARLISYRYELVDTIGRGGMGEVFKSYDRLTGDVIALKRVAMPLDRLAFFGSTLSDLNRSLAREFRTLASLRHPNIISVLDFGFDASNVPYYTMEYIEKPVTILEAGASLDLYHKVELVLQMLQTVAYLHRRNVLHRDLKPDNVLVIDGQVRVMDFGLAIETPNAAAASNDDLTGTIAYMAPELFSGEPVSRASDLWAVGIMLYELVLGRHPFSANNMAAQLAAIVRNPLDISRLADQPALAAVLQRLLTKSPHERYNDANEVIEDLCKATDYPLMPETQLIRESYLQASRFVGRQKELSLLRQGLEDAAKRRGSAWLIGGESGIGKSRLLDELRIDALTTGALVLSSRASAEQSGPYILWTNILRHLCLRTTLSDLEASVLKAIVPDIERLLDRPVADPPSLEGQNAQTRLINVIENVIRRQESPVMLVLENLHWAEESFALIKHLSGVVRDIPVVLIGSYRDDELPDLPKRLPEMRAIRMRRLSPDEVEQLSVGIVGETGGDSNVLEFLQRETEGNTLFLIEVIRALAEQAGRLDRIDQITLPASILAEGIRTPILNRLRKLPQADRPLLEFAAVAGRQLDLTVLTTAFPGLDINSWLVRCSDISLLEFGDEAWRFTHDKVRDVIVDDLAAAQRRDLHGRVAETMMTVYPGTTERSALIAFHWDKALDTTHPDLPTLTKAIDALEAAGQYALSTYAYSDVIERYERVLELEKIHRRLAAQSQGRTLPIAPERMAGWHSELGYAHLTALLLLDTSDHLEIAAKLLGYPIPAEGAAAGIGILVQLARQFIRSTILGFIPRTVSAEKRPTLTRIAQLDHYLANTYYWTNEQTRGLFVSLRSLNFAEKIGPSPELARTYGLMCVLTGTFGMKKLAQHYYLRGREISNQIGMPYLEAVVIGLSSVYYLHQGKIELVRKDLEHATRIALAAGDIALVQNLRLFAATSYTVRGEFDKSYEVLREVEKQAIQSHDPWRQVNGLIYLSRIDLIRGDQLGALEKITQTLSVIEDNNLSGPQLLDPWSFAAWIYLHNDQRDRALEAAENALHNAREFNTTGAIGIFSYPYLVEVYIALLDDKQANPDGIDLRDRLKTVIKMMTTFNAPAGEASVLRSRGMVALLDGKSDQAFDLWHQSAREAQEIKNPLDEGLAHLLLAKNLPAANPDRQKHHETAVRILSELGAEHYLAELGA